MEPQRVRPDRMRRGIVGHNRWSQGERAESSSGLSITTMSAVLGSKEKRRDFFTRGADIPEEEKKESKLLPRGRAYADPAVVARKEDGRTRRVGVLRHDVGEKKSHVFRLVL